MTAHSVIAGEGMWLLWRLLYLFYYIYYILIIFYYISFLILYCLLLHFANTILCSKDVWANPDISLIVEVLASISYWWIMYQQWEKKPNPIYSRECFFNFVLNQKFTQFWMFSPLEPEHLDGTLIFVMVKKNPCCLYNIWVNF